MPEGVQVRLLSSSLMKTTTTVTVGIADEEWLLYNGWKYRLEGGLTKSTWRLYIINEDNEPLSRYCGISTSSNINGYNRKTIDRRSRKFIDKIQKEEELRQRKHP